MARVQGAARGISTSRCDLSKLKHCALAVLAFVLVLSGSFVAKAEQSEAVTYLVQGTNYKFKESVVALRTFSGNGGTIKISFNASCTYGVAAGGYWDARLQKKVNGVWRDADQTSDFACSTFKRVSTLSFGKVPSGTYRLRFNKVSKSGTVTIHSFGVFRA
ncbi:hypothetical protein FB561_2067 [Kribbella amoyensis]|uniref:Uncharacterized protein n=1 Tax=Kribbella amoyensis TaxID=996641 RepID=A0A561BQ01_9ACTN|nr:hypothetical protein [Kribbella amoyensis]TWD80969.1 hypothetical protein FB561_2067 [Kribbella amoyensis]